MAENNKVQIDIVARDMASQALNSLQGGISNLSGAIGGLSSMFVGITGLLAGGAMFKDTISTTKEVTGEIVKLKNSFGITAEEASVLRVALDDVFLTADDVTGAASRITKQLVKNEEAFASLGVATRDSNGDFRSTSQIMAETNSKLLEFKAGTDRNVEGIKIYGKGWDEARKTLKLTAEVMEEGKLRAEQLHLIIGDSGLAAVKEYKKAMKDIGDVTESLKVNIGLALLPELTRLSVAFGDTAASAIPLFITGLHNVEAEMIRMAMLVDKTGGTITTAMFYMAGGKFTESGRWWKEQNDLYKQRYAENEKSLIKLAMLEVGLDENGNPLVKGKVKGGRTSTGAPTAKPEDKNNGSVFWDPGFMNWRMDQEGQKTESEYITRREAEDKERLANRFEFEHGIEQQMRDERISGLKLEADAREADTKHSNDQVVERYNTFQQYEQMKGNMMLNTANNAIGLMQVLGTKNKGFALAALAASKALAIGQTFVAGKTAELRALSDLGPMAGAAMIPWIEGLMWTNMGLIAATGLVQAHQATSGGGGGGYGGGTYSSPMVTQPVTNTQQQGNVTIVLKGIPNGKYIEEELIPGLNAAGTRNVRIEYLN